MAVGGPSTFASRDDWRVPRNHFTSETRKPCNSDADSVAVADPDSLIAAMRELRSVNLKCVVAVRGLKKFGLAAASLLQTYFSSYGAVTKVLIPHRMRKKAAQAGNTGFVLMYSSQAVQDILAAGERHMMLDTEVHVQAFQEEALNSHTVFAIYMKRPLSEGRNTNVNDMDYPSSSGASTTASTIASNQMHGPVQRATTPPGNFEDDFSDSGRYEAFVYSPSQAVYMLGQEAYLKPDQTPPINGQFRLVTPLPAGLVFNPMSGEISGMPAHAMAPMNIAVEADMMAGHTARASIGLEVVDVWNLKPEDWETVNISEPEPGRFEMTIEKPSAQKAVPNYFVPAQKGCGMMYVYVYPVPAVGYQQPLA